MPPTSRRGAWAGVVIGLLVTLATTSADAAPGSGPVVAMWAASGPRTAPPRHVGATPLRSDFASSTVGVLVVDGGTHQCSAATVASESRRLLVTAAHCVWLDGGWTLDGAYFVPGVDGDRPEPWGRWDVEAAWVPTAWQKSGSSIESVDSAHDIAVLRLAPLDGRLSEDALGAQGITFDSEPGQTVTALGYPGVGDFDGQTLQRCTGPATPETMDEGGGPVLVMRCDMTQGSSGGPWLTGPRAQTGRGQIVGVISGSPGTGDLISTRLGPEAERVYRDADRAQRDGRDPAT